MIEGKLVDLVPFEDDYALYLEQWMNEEAWFRTRMFDRREPHTEDNVKKFIETIEKNERSGLIGFQTKEGDPVGVLMYDNEWSRVRKVDVSFLAGDQRYEGLDEVLDGLLMLVRYCFETRNMHRLDSAALAFDEIKIEYLRRAGFVHEGTLRQHVRWDGGYADVEIFGMLASEWPGYEQKVTALDLEASGLEPKPKPEKQAGADQGGTD